MGGMIAINVTHRLASFVRGGVFSAPALMIDPVLMKYRPIVTFLQSFMPKFVVSRLAPGAMCHDPVVIEQYCYDILNTPGVKKPVPARTALQLVLGIEDAIACEKDFATPFLLMQGTEVMNEDNGMEVVSYAIDWINRHLVACPVCCASAPVHCVPKQTQEERICPFDCTQSISQTSFSGKARWDLSSERRKMATP